MAINYAIVKCKNPNGVQGTTYLAPRARKTSDYTFKELAEDIAHSTTCTKADAMAVLASIKPYIKAALLAGRRVVLNDLGWMVIGVRGKCFTQDMVEDPEFNPASMLKGFHVNFQLEPELKKEVASGIQYRRISSEWMK